MFVRTMLVTVKIKNKIKICTTAEKKRNIQSTKAEVTQDAMFDGEVEVIFHNTRGPSREQETSRDVS